MDGERYRELLLTAALDLHDRFGWVCIPIKYESKNLYPPAGWQAWAQQAPNLKCIRKYFVDRWDFLDALAVAVASTNFCFLDVDDCGELRRLSDRVRSLPHYLTSRGRQFIVPLASPPRSIFDLRSVGFTGELRAGWNLSILPPSHHRKERRAFYRWCKGLEAHVDQLTVYDLFKDAELTKKLVRRMGGPRQQSHTLCIGGWGEKDLCEQHASQADSIEYAIKETQPEHVGERLRMLPHLVRHIFRIKSRWEQAELLDMGDRWWRMARERRATRETTSTSTQKAILKLASDYDRRKAPFLNLAVEASKNMPPVHVASDLIRSAKNRDDNKRKIVQLATLCYALSAKQEDFFLSLRDAASIIGGSVRQASRLIQKLIQGGFLIRIDPGTPGKLIDGKAATYRWINHNDSQTPRIERHFSACGLKLAS